MTAVDRLNELLEAERAGVETARYALHRSPAGGTGGLPQRERDHASARGTPAAG
jgi:hypothetical protein